MRKFYLLFLMSVAFLCFNTSKASPIQRTTNAGTTVSTDTVYYVDFNVKPSTWTAGDYDIIAVGSTSSKTVNGITFCGGSYGERIHIKTTATVTASGNYSPASTDDVGANTGAISFIAASTGNAGGYLVLPQQQGAADVTVWACGANTGNTQSYRLEASKDNGSSWTSVGTFSTTDRYIHKTVFQYNDTAKYILKLTCTTGSKTNANLYIYNILITKRPSLVRTSAIGTDAQTVSTFANESIENIEYKWGSNADSAMVSWSGTSNTQTPPTGIIVSTDATTQKLIISGTPTVPGSYGYTANSTNGTLYSNSLTGTITVVSTPVPLISLTSTTDTKSQKVTAGNAMTNVQYTWGGSAVNAILSWTGTASSTTAPDGIVVSKDSLNEKINISGTPTTAGTYGWSIYSTDQTLNSPSLSGSLTVVPPPSVALTSDAATALQTVPFCNSITPIVFTYAGSATSASISWSGTTASANAPAGITITTNSTAKTITISGMPYLTGTYSYSIIATDGTNNSAACTGKIISSATASTQLSFPGAVGFGSHATGGRNGSVYHVTTLDDSGTGSLRDAVSSSNRIIVFDVSGVINLKTAISCKSNLTIEGQTAPGQGIAIYGGEISFAGQQNIICRHLRIVTGDPATVSTVSSTDDALSLYNARNAIFDHCTFEFAPWNNIDGVSDNYNVTPVTAITIQNSIDANPVGQQFGAHCESVLAEWTFYRNLFANSHNRNPLAKINDQFINNVHYNNEAGYTTHTGSTFKHDIVNNYFIGGPASNSSTSFPWFQVDGNQSIYNSGNLYDGNKDNQLNGVLTDIYWYSATGTLLSGAWTALTATIPTSDATSAYRTVISRVGTQPLTQLDSLIINQTKTLGTAGPSGGLYTSVTGTGLSNNGFGVFNAGTSSTDTDKDGMPDYWEQAMGTNTNSDDAMQLASSGYTNIELYANWLADLHATGSTNSVVSIDLNTICGGFSNVSPTYTLNATTNGTTNLLTDGHTMLFTPTSGFNGLASVRFTVTGSDNTVYTDTIRILVSPAITTAIKNINKLNVSVYPNPTTEYLTISSMPLSATYEIFDLSGRKVMSGTTKSMNSDQQINVRDLNSGIFTLVISSGKDKQKLNFIKSTKQ